MKTQKVTPSLQRGLKSARHECANSATPWRTIKRFADKDLMGLSAKPPRVTSFGKKMPSMGIYSHQSDIYFAKRDSALVRVNSPESAVFCQIT